MLTDSCSSVFSCRHEKRDESGTSRQSDHNHDETDDAGARITKGGSREWQEEEEAGKKKRE
jgi:hypothetical protein